MICGTCSLDMEMSLYSIWVGVYMCIGMVDYLFLICLIRIGDYLGMCLCSIVYGLCLCLLVPICILWVLTI